MLASEVLSFIAVVMSLSEYDCSSINLILFLQTKQYHKIMKMKIIKEALCLFPFFFVLKLKQNNENLFNPYHAEFLK